MHLVPPPDRSAVPVDVASGLTGASQRQGFRPAVTVLRGDRRDEQGFGTLAQWTAKGAHLLQLDLGIGPGDRIHVDVRPGWPLAAVCLAVWWVGATVTDDADAEVAVVDEDRPVPTGAVELLRTGAAVDGAPTGAVAGEPWALAVQPFPDAPPAPHADADLPALTVGARRFDQRELLADAAATGDPRGVLGVVAARLDLVTAVLTVAARPVATERATVVLDGADRAAADGDRVTSWL